VITASQRAGRARTTANAVTSGEGNSVCSALLCECLGGKGTQVQILWYRRSKRSVLSTGEPPARERAASGGPPTPGACVVEPTEMQMILLKVFFQRGIAHDVGS
jgi:hypothetical protein